MESIFSPIHYEHYCQVFEAFLEYSTVNSEDGAWIRCRITDLLSHIEKDTKLKVLSIGSGTESAFTKILKELSKIHLDFNNLDLVKNVSQLLQELGVTYKNEKVPWWLDVSGVFKDDEIGDLLLDMLTFIYKFKHFAPVPVQEAVMDRLKQFCSKENNKHILHLSSDVYIIGRHIK